MNLQKGRSCAGHLSNDLVNTVERKKKEIEIIGIAYISSMGSFQFIGLDSQIFILILGIRFVFPY